MLKHCYNMPCLRLGDVAPDFKAEAYFRGKPVDISLSNYRGQWVMLFFYPSDFTFV